LVVALILAQSIELAVAAELAHLAPQRLLAIGPRQKLEGANRQQIGIDANLVVGGQRVTAPQEAERRRLAQVMRADPRRAATARDHAALLLGTVTSRRISPMQSSAVVPSSSASGCRMTRWRSTAGAIPLTSSGIT